jgi:alkylation response protein AidB-like acyl-CoA dehydrogenase
VTTDKDEPAMTDGRECWRLPDTETTIGGSRTLLAPADERADELRQLVRTVLAPHAARAREWDAAGRLPRGVFADLGRAGAFRRRWEKGRTDGLELAVALAEETAAVSSGLGLGVTLHSEVVVALLDWLGKDHHDDLHSAALDGQAIGCFAITEPRGGSDIESVTCTVERTSPSGWHLVGEKRFISNAAVATHALVLARSTGLAEGRNHCLVVVPMDHPGVTVTGSYPKLGGRDCDASHIVLDVELPDEAILGVPGLGLIYVMKALQHERIAVSAQLVSAARASLRLAVAYMRRRTQFDRRLLDHQALRHRVADATTRVWAAESFLSAVVLAAKGGRDVGHESAALKLFCAQMAGEVVDETIQFLGGRGYTSNYPLERVWRDVRLARIGAGTDEIMRELVANRADRSDRAAEALLDRLDAADEPWDIDSEKGEPR